MTAHVHSWEPVHGWYARYRCSSCFVLGYKQRTVTSFGSADVVPYLCVKTVPVPGEEKRRACGEPVVYTHVDEPAPRLCPAHEAERHGKLVAAAERAKQRAEKRASRRTR